jgi:hypothetical protein
MKEKLGMSGGAPRPNNGNNGNSAMTAIIVLTALFIVILVIIVACLASVNSQKTAPVSEIFLRAKVLNEAAERVRGSHQLRMAKPIIKRRPGPALAKMPGVHMSNFTAVLPGGADVKRGETRLATSVDLRPYLRRGDPVKVGPQLFVVDTETLRGDHVAGLKEQDYKQAFTATSLPLGSNGFWEDAKHRKYAVLAQNRGRLRGFAAEGVPVYTAGWVSEGTHRWVGPRGGAVGYWGKGGEWVVGDCLGACKHWYSPLWLGPKGKQMVLDIDLYVGCDGDYCPTPQMCVGVESVESIESIDGDVGGGLGATIPARPLPPLLSRNSQSQSQSPQARQSWETLSPLPVMPAMPEKQQSQQPQQHQQSQQPRAFASHSHVNGYDMLGAAPSSSPYAQLENSYPETRGLTPSHMPQNRVKELKPMPPADAGHHQYAHQSDQTTTFNIVEDPEINQNGEDSGYTPLPGLEQPQEQPQEQRYRQQEPQQQYIQQSDQQYDPNSRHQNPDHETRQRLVATHVAGVRAIK